MSDRLDVWLAGARAGRLDRVAGRVTFEYDQAYADEADVPPLSWSMPPSRPDHGPEAVENRLDNLLPDSDAVRERWARPLGMAPATGRLERPR
jgi:serine/threonine-protein kinase HipA